MAKAESKPVPPRPGTPSPPRKEASVDEVLQQLREKPGKVLGWTVSILVALLAAWLVNHFVRESRAKSAQTRHEQIGKLLSERDAAIRARIADDVLGSLKGEPEEAYVLIHKLLAQRDAALAEHDHAQRLSLFRDCLATAETLRGLGNRSIFNALPRRPPHATGGEARTFAEEAIAYCKDQIAWLEVTTPAPPPSPDPGLKVRFVLLDGDGKEHPLEIVLFSGEAPQTVHGFLEMVRASHFDGTLVFALQQDDPNTEENHAVILGSPFSRLAPDRPELWGTPADTAGFTIPLEANRLKMARGRVALERRMERNLPIGSEPLSLVIVLMDEVQDLGRTVFGEVVGSEETLQALDRLAASKDRVLGTERIRSFAPQTPWKVQSVTVEGTPATPDPGGVRRVVRIPTVPEKSEAPR